jgi:hypothetical protein
VGSQRPVRKATWIRSARTSPQVGPISSDRGSCAGSLDFRQKPVSIEQSFTQSVQGITRATCRSAGGRVRAGDRWPRIRRGWAPVTGPNPQRLRVIEREWPRTSGRVAGRCAALRALPATAPSRSLNRAAGFRDGASASPGLPGPPHPGPLPAGRRKKRRKASASWSPSPSTGESAHTRPSTRK